MQNTSETGEADLGCRLGQMLFGCCPRRGKVKVLVEGEIAHDDSPIINDVFAKAEDIPDGEKKMFEIRGKKILVINDGGQFYGINGLCAHYKFPLDKGIYANGRIRCPLHGACFNVKTGDIEDFPGLGSLNAYQIIHDNNGDLRIHTSEKKLNSDKRFRTKKVNVNNDLPIIVIGSGPATVPFIESARKNGILQPIIVASKEKFPHYDRVALSKKPYSTGENLKYVPDQFYEDMGVTLRMESEVTSIDPILHTVTLRKNELIKYSKVVIATGGVVRKLKCPGNHLQNIHYLRAVEDANIIAKATEGKHVLCVGASFIGMEIASAIVGKAASVKVICSTPEPLPAFAEDIGKAVRERFESKGVVFYTSEQVISVRGIAAVEGVELKSGRKLTADVIVAGIGINPATDFLTGSGIDLDENGFIKVDKNFRTNGHMIYAIGDVVSAPLPFWGLDRVNIQHFQVAQTHGDNLGYAIAGKAQPRPVRPFFWSNMFLEFSMKMAGRLEGHDRVITSGDVDDLDFVRYYLKDEVVIAVVSAGPKNTPIVFLEILAQGKKITKPMVDASDDDDYTEFLKKPKNTSSQFDSS